MKPEKLIEVIRHAATGIFASQKTLNEACDRLSSIASTYSSSPDFIVVLKELIISRVGVLGVFELLVILDKSSAIESLHRRYIGTNIDPDKNMAAINLS